MTGGSSKARKMGGLSLPDVVRSLLSEKDVLMWDDVSCVYVVLDGKKFESRFNQLRRVRDKTRANGNERPFSRMHNFFALEVGDKWARTGTQFRPLDSKGLPYPPQFRKGHGISNNFVPRPSHLSMTSWNSWSNPAQHASFMSVNQSSIFDSAVAFPINVAAPSEKTEGGQSAGSYVEKFASGGWDVSLQKSKLNDSDRTAGSVIEGKESSPYTIPLSVNPKQRYSMVSSMVSFLSPLPQSSTWTDNARADTYHSERFDSSKSESVGALYPLFASSERSVSRNTDGYVMKSEPIDFSPEMRPVEKRATSIESLDTNPSTPVSPHESKTVYENLCTPPMHAISKMPRMAAIGVSAENLYSKLEALNESTPKSASLLESDVCEVCSEGGSCQPSPEGCLNLIADEMDDLAPLDLGHCAMSSAICHFMHTLNQPHVSNHHMNSVLSVGCVGMNTMPVPNFSEGFSSSDEEVDEHAAELYRHVSGAVETPQGCGTLDLCDAHAEAGDVSVDDLGLESEHSHDHSYLFSGCHGSSLHHHSHTEALSPLACGVNSSGAMEEGLWGHMDSSIESDW